MEKTKNYRKKKGFTIVQMAEHVGLTPNIVSKLEKDNIQITADVVLAFEKLGIKIKRETPQLPREVDNFKKYLQSAFKKADVYVDLSGKIIIVTCYSHKYQNYIKTTLPLHKVEGESNAKIRNEALGITRDIVELFRERIKEEA